jgi:hypothetical protein
MGNKPSIRRLVSGYAILISLYPRAYRERFAAPMKQTFIDLLRERAEKDERLLGFAFWIFVETLAGIVKENAAVIVVRYRSLVRVALATALLLLVPLAAMQFTAQVNWGLFDFALMGALLFGTGLVFELLARKALAMTYRSAAGIALASLLLLVWVTLAVGIIGSEDNTANLMYLGVLVVGCIGGLIARFRPEGMARTLFAMASAQALVPVIALLLWQPQSTSWGAAGVFGVFVLNAFFVLLFAVSGLLFRTAARERPGAGSTLGGN